MLIQGIAIFASALVALDAPSAPSVATPPTARDVAALTAEINDAVRKGKDKALAVGDFCACLKRLAARVREHANSPDPSFQLARSSLSRLRDVWSCPRDPGKPPPDLWSQFNKTKAAYEAAESPEDKTRLQEALSVAGVLLLNRIPPTDPRFSELLQLISIYVLSRDADEVLRQIAVGLPQAELAGERGRKIADSVAILAGRLGPSALGPQARDALVSFVARVAKENPEWLQTAGSGHLLDVVFGALDGIPLENLDAARLGPLFDFVSRVMKQDPQWLDGERAAALAAFVPRLLEHMDVGRIKKEDLDAVLAFNARILSGGAKWPEQMRDIARNWTGILQIVEATANPQTRAVIGQAIQTVCTRNHAQCDELKNEMGGKDPDPDVVIRFLRALGANRVEEIRKEQAALEEKQLLLKLRLRLRTLVGLQLPSGCDDRQRDSTQDALCASALAYADHFRTAVIGGAPEQGDAAPEFTGPIDTMLNDAECTALPGRHRTRDGKACTPNTSIQNTFASFVGLEIQREPTGGGGATLQPRAGCVVVSETDVVDRVEMHGIPVAAGPEGAVLAIQEAQHLGERMLSRCRLSRPQSDLAAALLERGKVTQNSSEALIFAGLPYLRDVRPNDGPSRKLAWTLSALDASTLLLGAGGLIGAVYVNNSSGPPWNDRLLRGGVVLLGSNLVIKGLSAWYYHHRYGRRP